MSPVLLLVFDPEATVNGFYLWPNIIANCSCPEPGSCFDHRAWLHPELSQIVHNCYIGMTRIMVAMSLDRVLPEWFSKVDERFHTPVNAHLAYFLASIPIIFAYNLVPGMGWLEPWRNLRLWVCIYHHLTWPGALLPYKAKRSLRASPGAKSPLCERELISLLFTLLRRRGIYLDGLGVLTRSVCRFSGPGLAGTDPLCCARWVGILYPMRTHLMEWARGEKAPWFIGARHAGRRFRMAMVAHFLALQSLGVLGNWDFSALPKSLWAQIIALGIIIVSAVWYYLTKVSQKHVASMSILPFKEVPPE